MAIFTVKIDDRKFRKTLNRLEKGVKDYKKPLKDSGDFSAKVFLQNFEITGTEFIKWRPLAPATLKTKARFGFPSAPLIGTGKMKRSFAIFKLDRFSVTIGNRLENQYFKYHQLGGKKIPQRLMIDINKRMKQKIVNIFHSYLKKLIKG